MFVFLNLLTKRTFIRSTADFIVPLTALTFACCRSQSGHQSGAATMRRFVAFPQEPVRRWIPPRVRIIWVAKQGLILWDLQAGHLSKPPVLSSGRNRNPSSMSLKETNGYWVPSCVVMECPPFECYGMRCSMCAA